MIILNHVTIERFRLLRQINLHFPQHGSILISGPNEAGKSALLESIYFALYGAPLAANSGKRTLDDLIFYGSPHASVTLTISIGATELTISRVIERGKGQQATLQVRKLGMPDEQAITDLDAANERIIAELGHMDGEALRHSCLIEQKALGLLEQLPGHAREATLSKLLGLKKMLKLTERFKLTPNDEHLLHESSERLKLAEAQARIPVLSEQLAQIEAALDAITVAEDLAEISLQETEIAEQQLSLEQLAAQRADLKGRLNRVQQLQRADNTLAEIIAAYDALAEAQRELPGLDHQIAELDRREREELPALEKRVNDLTDLIRSFGTLERMSNDLLNAVNSIKELEQEIKRQQELQQESNGLDEQIINARLQVDQLRQSLNELVERWRTSRPKLEARLQRLQSLQERLLALHQLEEAYNRHVKQQDLAEENSNQLKKVEQDLQETEQVLAQAESKAREPQQQAEALEKRWRQASIVRQLQEWRRLKSIFQSQAEAEQQVMAAHRNQERLTHAALDARNVANRWLMLIIACAALALLAGVGALFVAPHQTYAAAGMGLLALVLLAAAGFSYQSYKRAHNEEQVVHQQMQEAISHVGMLVAARETAMRAGNVKRDALGHIEHELHLLGSAVPHTLEDAQHLLEQLEDTGESLTDIQQKVSEQREAAQAARDKVNTIMEAIADLRKEQARLEELREREQWDDIIATLRAERIAVEDKQHEIATLAGQEGLPIPSFDATGDTFAATTYAELEAAVADTIKATEQEIGSLNDKLASESDLARQVKLYQDTLDLLVARKDTLAERRKRFQTQDPLQQIERAREQQLALRTALQALQDSLRQRVKTLGVTFGQTAISNAEATARKQLEALHFSLGSRIELQSRRSNYVALQRDRRDALANHYNQLAKLSGSLGSWIVPPNPFADTLAALRSRCQQEIAAADEHAILQGLEKLRLQENASKAKIELCRQEIENAQERIASMLVQRNRPLAKRYTPADIVAVWPLVGKYTTQDRERLLAERKEAEQALQQSEQQELELSSQLQTGGEKLDLEQARLCMQQQERSYQTKERGNLLLKAASERLLRKVVPRTEYHMQQLLPLLTGGRYHDVHLTTEVEEDTISGGPLQLFIWDPGAGTFVAKSTLSGGAADQLSLALRLAFAISVLPRELTAAPGFILLDEPLNSFDRSRTQALVDVINRELLGQHFEQALFVSHSDAFDSSMFPYHVSLEDGVIVESNLPGAPPVPRAVVQEAAANHDDNKTNAEDDEDIPATTKMPAFEVMGRGSTHVSSP